MPTITERLAGRLQEAVESRTNTKMVSEERFDLLEATAKDHRALRKELDLLGWAVQDYISGQPQEVNAPSRRKFAQQARTVWANDPLIGGTITLRNNYVFGRGVPAPRAKDPEVQKVIDEAWNDEDNQAVLTSLAAQLALGVDLELTSNLFFLIFDDGDDGKVKLGLLDHDTVEDVVRDPENRLRVLYYVAKERKREWDYKTDSPKFDPQQSKTVYYAHWRNQSEDEKTKPPSQKLGHGRVYHVSINRTSEQVFGTPSLRRTIRWASALNDYLGARVDVMNAAAAFLMKRKVKGTPTQVANLAAKAISRNSPLSATNEGEQQLPPRAGAILTENEAVDHIGFNLNTGASNAMQDVQMLRSQLSVATGFPQHYLGDSTATSLGTATALEGPVLKGVEAVQEIFEQVFRWFLERAIERAVEVGRLSKTVAGESNDELTIGSQRQTGEFGPQSTSDLQAADGEDSRGEMEAETERDLTFELSMPNPLRRSMTDLIGAVSNVAKTFDPNATNIELSRALLAIALGEGLEVQEPGQMVEAIFPEGYVDPAVQQTQQRSEAQFNHDEGPDPDNPYGAPMNGQFPDGQGGVAQEALYRRGREDQLSESEMAELARSDTESRIAEFDHDFLYAVEGPAMELLSELTATDPAKQNGQPETA